MALTVYTAIPNSDIDPESPITTSLMTNLRNNPIAMVHQYIGAPHLMYQYDPVLANHGAEADGSLTISSNQNVDRAIYECVNFTVNASITLTGIYNVLIIRATGTITINGDINCRGSDITNKGGIGSNLHLGGPGGGGGGGGAGDADGDVQNPGLDGYAGESAGFVSGGARGFGGFSGNNSASTGQDGSAASALSSDEENDQQRLAGILVAGGANGGDGGHGGKGATSGNQELGGESGTGGVGGGLVMLIAPTIVIGAGSTIRADGQTGENATAGAGSNAGSGGGGGGGGGGAIYMIGHSITNNGSSSVTAGSGGLGNTTNNDGGDGAAGAAGYTKEITLTE